MKLLEIFLSTTTTLVFYMVTGVAFQTGESFSSASPRQEVVKTVSREEVEKLPFICPYELPDEISDDTIEGHGFDPQKDISRVSSEFYAQFNAARALVPCGATALRVFTEADIEHTGPRGLVGDNTVSVIYVYEESVDKIKKWLQEKYEAKSYKNPIREAVIEQCPEVKHSYGPWLKTLNGDEILNILCEQNCTTNIEYHSIRKRDHQYGVPSSHYIHPSPLNVTNATIQYHPPNTAPYHPYATGHHPTYPADAHYQAPQQYPPSYNAVHDSYHPPKKVRFDDAPEPEYGVAARFRRFSPCTGPDEEICQELERENKIVNCSQPRFSECDSEWVDCVDENERYLIAVGFYESCEQDGSFDTDLEVASDDTCFENRLCQQGQLRNDDERFVGFAPEDECTCDLKEPVYNKNYYAKQSNRYKRQKPGTGETRTSGSGGKRLIQAQNGDLRLARDKAIKVKVNTAKTAVPIARKAGFPRGGIPRGK